MQQGIELYSQEWFKKRLGKVTSSTIWNLIVEPKEKAKKDAGELSSTSKEYLLSKVAEKLTGVRRDFQNDATAFGVEQEANAISLYELETGYSVSQTGYIEKITDWYGGTPDGYIEKENGIIQVKCPYDYKNHLSNLLTDSVELFKAKHREYYWQCMSDMFVTGANWCDFVSYCPDMPADYKLSILRIKRSEEDIEILSHKISEAYKFFNSVINKLADKHARIS
jgi:hypothetical protein